MQLGHSPLPNKAEPAFSPERGTVPLNQSCSLCISSTALFCIPCSHKHKELGANPAKNLVFHNRCQGPAFTCCTRKMEELGLPSSILHWDTRCSVLSDALTTVSKPVPRLSTFSFLGCSGGHYPHFTHEATEAQVELRGYCRAPSVPKAPHRPGPLGTSRGAKEWLNRPMIPSSPPCAQRQWDEASFHCFFLWLLQESHSHRWFGVKGASARNRMQRAWVTSRCAGMFFFPV